MTWRGLGFSSALAPIGVLLLFTIVLARWPLCDSVGKPKDSHQYGSWEFLSVVCVGAFTQVSKRYQTTVRNPAKTPEKVSTPLHHMGNVKKVRTPRLQGLDPGEIVFRDFPIRLQKSRE